MRAERRLAAVMFTDIEGFTALMHNDEDLAFAKRDKYTRIVEEQHAAFGGNIVQFFGDGSLSSFENSVDAVVCAVEIQRLLRDTPEVPVRVGIHVGNVLVEPTGLIGDAVNIASRIESFGFPGAVMVSDSVHDQVKNRSDLEFVDVGKYRLKNVGRPFSIYAVAAGGLAVPAPDALKGKGERLVSLPGNLPDPRTRVLGREDDLAFLKGLLAEHRVVTITGPGGIGKTRTAIELCRRSSSEFLDSISFAGMADVTNAADFLPALADVLDVKEAEGRSPREGIVGLIGDRKALLLLDNMEQAVDAAPDIADIVASCPELRVVVTSRSPLRIGSEREYRLAPLALPPQGDRIELDLAAASPAVALFAERARAVEPNFELNAENALAVAEVCRRMDGVPLAIELAAARIRILEPEALLARLQHALDLLTGGMRDLPERQQTLRAAIDWSHSLLGDAERRLFRRMAVFSGSATLDAVEAVCSDGSGRVLDALESLVDQALVVARGGTFSMLQIMREFAAERLEEAGERTAVTSRHARYYAGVASEIGSGIEAASEQLVSMERGVNDEANIEAAFDHLVEQAEFGDAEAAELAMGAHGDLWMYWHIRGKHLSARSYARTLLESSDAPSRGRSRVLTTAGLASWTLRDYAQALEEFSESYRIAEQLGQPGAMANATVGLVASYLVTDPEKGLPWASKGIELGRELGYMFHLSQILTFDGILHAISGDAATAVARYEEALSIQESRGDFENAGLSLGGLAQLAAMRGDTATALELYERSRAAFEAVGDRAEEARVLGEMAWAHLTRGDSEKAREMFLDSAQAYDDVGSIPGIGTSMIGLAAVEAAEGRQRRALTISHAAQRFAQEEGIINIYSADSPGHPYLETARAQLSANAIAQAEADGRALSVAEALSMVRG